VVKAFKALATARSLRTDRGHSIAVFSSPQTSSRKPLQAPRVLTSSVSEKTSTLTSIRLLGNGLSERGLEELIEIVDLG